MDKFPPTMKGYLYILAVKGIDLPVCKIGMTSREPAARCAEINQSSTGDFIWEVAHQLPVNDCKKLESLVHEKLEPLRQKRREFFNIYPDEAIRAVVSIMATQQDLVEIPIHEISPQSLVNTTSKKKVTTKSTRRNIDNKYMRLLDLFTELLGVKGRPFGQLNQPVFGISDGCEGVQWNIAIYPVTQEARVGVNLEGLEYSGWPITTLILAEIEAQSMLQLIPSLQRPDQIFVRFTRDAWQVNSRPPILEQHLIGREFAMSEVDSALWKATLIQALACLNRDRNYRGRSRQEVTLVSKPRSGAQKRTMWVSPHLNIWMPVDMENDSNGDLAVIVERLMPVHEWVSRTCGQIVFEERHKKAT